MFAITLALLVCQHLSVTWSTRLPLEVYELTPPIIVNAATAQQQQQHNDLQQQQHKNLEYATINAKQQQQQTTNLTKTTIEILSDVATGDDDDVAATATAATTKSNSQQLDRRRSRQMLDIMQQQHRFDHAALQHHLHHSSGSSSSSSSHQKLQQQQHQQNTKDVRILYQVGESEDDLPICAQNAVCSKIDLYETPWIERQCRCPDVNRIPNIVIHHHNSNGNSNSNNNNNKEPLEITSYSHIPVAAAAAAADKYRSYYEKEKLLQHKRLLVSDFGDKRFDSLHLKKIMQKLGAVYQDDLDLQPSDFLETNEDIVGRDEFDLDDINENEFPHMPRRNERLSASSVHQQQQHGGGSNAAHMRHSGHSNRAKELSYIGGCPSGLGIEDGHTIADKTRHYKLCSPVHKLPVCKHFREYTWTLTTSAELNVTEQIVHCRCPKNSVTYLTKREATTNGSGGFAYFFACSPLTRIRCQRKQPCKLFTVRKRQEFLDEVNINALCQCPKGHHCPGHHTQSGVIPGESFLEDNIQTYSGYCMAND